jgi:hypothetical protein
MILKKRLIFLATICAATMLMLPFVADSKHKCPPVPATLSGAMTITETTGYPTGLVIANDAVITVPAGKSLTMTVNGVETGQKLVTTAGLDTKLIPGKYMGYVVLTVAEANPVEYVPGGPPGTPHVFFPFRQALFVDDTGVVDSESVFAAVQHGKVTGSYAKNVKITSTGECFDGIYVIDHTYKIENSRINFTGNGRSDFIGYGAAIVGTGEETTLVVDGANIVTRGVARPAIVADGGSNVIVKNSHIQTYNGILPSDYIGTIDTTQMRSVPWMLGLSGNCRATNLLGTNTKASYINSYIGAEGWGVLSTDGCTTPKLTAINSTIAITGKDGYGSYGIGEATERFLGCTFNVATYATISRGSFLYYGDSDPATISQLNTDLGLGLTDHELKSLHKKNTVVNSERFGIMWHGGGTLDITGGTIFNTKKTTFLDKGQAIAITVDGSKGAKLNPGNGVIMQVMDDDDCGPNMAEGGATSNIYYDPTMMGIPVPDDPGHDVYNASSNDALVTFSNIKLKGNFFNSTRGGIVAGPFGPPSSTSKNMALALKNASITGVITSSTAVHSQAEITSADYRLLGEVTNTASAAVHNGVLVSLTEGSKWVVTGTSYLTSLTVGDGSSVIAPKGYSINMTVNGVETEIQSNNTYTGTIMLTIN